MKTASAISEPMNLLLTNIHCLFQVAAKGELYLGGAQMRDPACIEDAWVYVAEGKIAALGRMQSLDKESFTEYQELDCGGRLVLPGFVDSHTHLVFPRTREREFVYRIQGLSYEEIAARGGGILNSARSLSQISDAQLLEEALERAYEILHRGTTTVEIKSGYGLSLEGELRLLRVARQIGTLTPLNVRTTFLGAHAIPAEYKTRRQAYIDLICEEMLPAVAAEGLADYIDVFCEKIAFSAIETERILEAGVKYGLKPKIHTNQFHSMGGIEAAIKYGAISVDHLEVLSESELQLLRTSKTIATLLPSAPFFLNDSNQPPARQLLNR
ncbi:MAG: imidazolonepropionase, partial [Bacteroidetes bacterium]